MKQQELMNKRFAIFGLQDSGKTTFAKWVIKQFSNHFVYDIMDEYQGFNRYVASFRGEPEAEPEFDEATRSFVLAHKEKIEMYVIDEANRVHNKYVLRGSLLELNDSTAHYEMALGIIARRPEQVHTDLVDLAHYIFVFHSDGHRTTNLLNDIHEGLGDAAIMLGQFEYLMYEKGSGKIIKCEPIKIEGFIAKKGF